MSAKTVAERVAKGIRYALLLFILLFFLLMILARSTFIIEMPIRVLFGWAIHGWKALPPFLANWHEATLPIGCLLMAAVIGHRFVRRWVDEKFPRRTWRIRHTTAALSLLLLGSAAAIAMSGVMHQFFWLAGGKVLYDNRKSEMVVAMGNGRQLMMALWEFQDEKGRYPDSFEELETAAGEYSYAIRRLSWLDSRDREVPEPWILLRPGFSEVALADEPVIVSPVIAARGLVVVGYGDTSIRMMRAEELPELLGLANAEEIGARK